MKKLVKILMLITPFLLSSCGQLDEPSSPKTVAVEFDAAIPNHVVARAGTGDLMVDQVVCAVFHSGVEIASLRQTLPATSGAVISYTPRLAVGQQYDILFFAIKSGAYDVTNLSDITRIPGKTEAEYEAFYARETIIVEGGMHRTVTMTRPMGKIVIATTPDDFEASAKLGLEPTRMVLRVSEVPSGFNALNGQASNAVETTFNLDSSCEVLTVPNLGGTFISLGECFVFESAKSTVSVTFTLYDGDAEIITKTIDNVPVERNIRTNIVGSLITGEVSDPVALPTDSDITNN